MHWGEYYSLKGDFRQANTERPESELAKLSKQALVGNRHQDDTLLLSFERIYQTELTRRRGQSEADNAKVSAEFATHKFLDFYLSLSDLPYEIDKADYLSFLRNLEALEGKCWDYRHGQYVFKTSEAAEKIRDDPWLSRPWESHREDGGTAERGAFSTAPWEGATED